ncbi:hypothetical protein I1A62_04165 (plasmid) [Rhodococcus sp. USK10]|uniref:hypothetical protein n=1 Tax=Rhodococcus sp. USK10 TaxID=2789739 RepID=UPI001C5FE5FD|nr:hypothetical protein [Rhodococcus sp. USK10]QYB00257.1 hypothetical protein I1A62_04165 [Rhodococcus sp. USK10]
MDTLWMQKQPGYVGNSPAHRGEISHDGLLTLRELADSFEQWWVRVGQNRPHDGLRDRDIPSRKFTPNQMYAVMFDAGAGIPVPIDEHTYIALMPLHRRVLQPGAGFKINNLVYRSDDLQPLMTMRPGTKDGKWEVRCETRWPGLFACTIFGERPHPSGILDRSRYFFRITGFSADRLPSVAEIANVGRRSRILICTLVLRVRASGSNEWTNTAPPHTVAWGAASSRGRAVETVRRCSALDVGVRGGPLCLA